LNGEPGATGRDRVVRGLSLRLVGIALHVLRLHHHQPHRDPAAAIAPPEPFAGGARGV